MFSLSLIIIVQLKMSRVSVILLICLKVDITISFLKIFIYDAHYFANSVNNDILTFKQHLTILCFSFYNRNLGSGWGKFWHFSVNREYRLRLRSERIGYLAKNFLLGCSFLIFKKIWIWPPGYLWTGKNKNKFFWRVRA